MVADLSATRDVVADLSARRFGGLSTNYEVTLRIVGSKCALETRKMSVAVRMI